MIDFYDVLSIVQSVLVLLIIWEIIRIPMSWAGAKLPEFKFNPGGGGGIDGETAGKISDIEERMKNTEKALSDHSKESRANHAKTHSMLQTVLTTIKDALIHIEALKSLVTSVKQSVDSMMSDGVKLNNDTWTKLRLEFTNISRQIQDLHQIVEEIKNILPNDPKYFDELNQAVNHMQTDISTINANIGKILQGQGDHTKLLNEIKKSLADVEKLENTILRSLGGVHKKLNLINDNWNQYKALFDALGKINWNALETNISDTKKTVEKIDQAVVQVENNTKHIIGQNNGLFKKLKEIKNDAESAFNTTQQLIVKSTNDIRGDISKLKQKLDSDIKKLRKASTLIIKLLRDIEGKSNEKVLQAIANFRKENQNEHEVILDGIEEILNSNAENKEAIINWIIEIYNYLEKAISHLEQNIEIAIELSVEESNETLLKKLKAMQAAIKSHVTRMHNQTTKDITKEISESLEKILKAIEELQKNPDGDGAEKLIDQIKNIYILLGKHNTVNSGNFSAKSIQLDQTSEHIAYEQEQITQELGRIENIKNQISALKKSLHSTASTHRYKRAMIRSEFQKLKSEFENFPSKVKHIVENVAKFDSDSLVQEKLRKYQNISTKASEEYDAIKLEYDKLLIEYNSILQQEQNQNEDINQQQLAEHSLRFLRLLDEFKETLVEYGTTLAELENAAVKADKS